MNLESFPNELLCELFTYIPSIDCLRSFYHLNYRFQQLLIYHFQSFNVSFSFVSHDDFRSICQQSLPIIAPHLISLTLSNNHDTLQQINSFLEHGLKLRQFHQLQRLSLCDLCSNEIMHTMILEWKYLPNLTHLTLAGCYLNFDHMSSQHLMSTIWSLPKLIYCYLNLYFENNDIVPTVISSSLTYLYIWGTQYHQQNVYTLLKQTPYLQDFSIILNPVFDHINNDRCPCLSLKSLQLHLDRLEENQLIELFQDMANLRHLNIDVSELSIHSFEEILNGYQWEHIIRQYLPNLKQFRFNIEMLLINLDNREEHIDVLLDSFRHPFWLEEHQWFIQCHWNLTDKSSPFYLYTLPYRSTQIKFSPSTIRKSTCQNDRICDNYNHVKILEYKTDSLQTTTLLPQIRFPNISHLSIQFPIQDQFWSLIFIPYQITSLTISGNVQDITLSQLHELIHHLPCLNSLRLETKSLSISSICSLDIVNTSIRRLDLRDYYHHFNHEQCSILSHSLFNSQCEILSINLLNRHALLEMMKTINNNLRVIIVQFANDLQGTTSDDQFLSWLKNHLPSTYIITRDTYFLKDIHIILR